MAAVLTAAIVTPVLQLVIVIGVQSCTCFNTRFKCPDLPILLGEQERNEWGTHIGVHTSSY